MGPGLGTASCHLQAAWAPLSPAGAEPGQDDGLGWGSPQVELMETSQPRAVGICCKHRVKGAQQVAGSEPHFTQALAH